MEKGMHSARRSIVAIAIVTVLGSCASPSDSEPAETESTIDPRDVTTWSPSFIPASDPITSVDESRSRLDQVAQVLRPQGLPIPNTEDELPEVVRAVSSYDAATLWAQCLTQQGFDSDDAGGFVSTKEVVPEQADIYWQTYADCVAQYPVSAKYLQAWGSDQWKVQYEYLVDYYIPCVESYGITIDRDSIPTEQVYVESGLSQADVWHPARDWMDNPEYAQFASTETSEGAEIASTCRQSAPDEKLFG